MTSTLSDKNTGTRRLFRYTATEMVDEFRAVLDEMMGKNRNLDCAAEDFIDEHFTDPKWCKGYLAGCCIKELLHNTRVTKGECEQRHSVEMRDRYNEAPDREKYAYEYNMYHAIERELQNCDYKVREHIQRVHKAVSLPETLRVQLESQIESIDTLLEELE
ncbi:Luc7-related protein, partial [Kipferlia bialata]|eukprot:g6973.t1